jgi:glycosyltransferase involved in cell wall biosynthesis
MRICYLGNYNPDYARHNILMKGLRKNGIDFFECRFSERGAKLFFRLLALRKEINKADIIFVAYSDLRFVWLVRLITRKPIFWDAFYSLYDNWIFDRKLAKPVSLKAFYLWFADWICCKTADVVILDTKANCDYFVKTFRVRPEKMMTVLIGADDEQLVASERKKNTDKFLVEFHGNYIPVQGVEYIIRAAKRLEDENVMFKMIGSGQTRKMANELARELNVKNIEFIDSVPFREIRKYLVEADVSLGLLGSVDRARRAIANKVYEASAMKRVSINIESPAIRDLYSPGEDILTVEAGNVDDLVTKILWARDNPEKMKEMEDRAYLLFKNNATPEKIVLPLIEKFHNFIDDEAKIKK